MSNIEQIKRKLTPVFDMYHVRKAILFGSFAKGKEQKNSDVDIYVDSGLKGLQFYGLLEDVVSSLDRPVDLIDSSQVRQGSPVMEEINKTGVLIYG